MRLSILLMLGFLSLLAGCASWRSGESRPSAPSEFHTTFLTFSDLASADLQKPYTVFRIYERDYDDPATHHMPAFEDAHAVRALAVAYDLTGQRRYLDACRRWASWAVDCQSRMIPKGAYYMNHSRAPGEDTGQWNAADSGTVGMGVLATALRCDGDERERYLNSVRSFLKLVMDNYVKSEGGISNGLWPEFDGPWWCSTATVGKLALLMHRATREEPYRVVGLGGMRWLAGHDFRELKPITFAQRPSGTIFYCFDFYATGLDDQQLETSTRELILDQFEAAAKWLSENQKTRGAPIPHYTGKNVDMAAMPSLMYAFGQHAPDRFGLLAAPADEELRYIRKLLLDGGTPNVSSLMIWEVLTWGMMSYAERLAPGSISQGRVYSRG